MVLPERLFGQRSVSVFFLSLGWQAVQIPASPYAVVSVVVSSSASHFKVELTISVCFAEFQRYAMARLFLKPRLFYNNSSWPYSTTMSFINVMARQLLFIYSHEATVFEHRVTIPREYRHRVRSLRHFHTKKGEYNKWITSLACGWTVRKHYLRHEQDLLILYCWLIWPIIFIIFIL